MSSFDPYQMCPCQSGKKLKFCCMEVALEMDKIVHLQENNQLRPALKQLEKLEQTHPGYAWPATSHASILMESGDYPAARDRLELLFKKDPSHPLARMLDAIAALHMTGFHNARKEIHLAIRLCLETQRQLVQYLLVEVCMQLEQYGFYMAARQHLALALKLAGEAERGELLQRLMAFDGNQQIPYPLRGAHRLATCRFDDEAQQQTYQKALKLAKVGFWQSADQVLTKLAEEADGNAELWQNIAFCRAWNADHEAAVAAFEKASNNFSESSLGSAVECGLLAEVLRLHEHEHQTELVVRKYYVSSPSQMLSRLDNVDRLIRTEVPEGEDEHPDATPSAVFQWIDRDALSEVSREQTALTDLPKVSASVSFYDANDQREQAVLFVALHHDADLEPIQQTLKEQVGEFITEPDPEVEHAPHMHDSLPKPFSAMRAERHYPEKTSRLTTQHFRLEHWRNYTRETWMQTPLPGLQNRKPAELEQTDADRIAALVAVHTLDAYANTEYLPLDMEAVCEQLNVPHLPLVKLEENADLSLLSNFELLHVDVGELSAHKLRVLVNRALMMHHHNFSKRVLTEALNRGADALDLDHAKLMQALSSLHFECMERETAFAWLDKARTQAQSRENAFEESIKWEMQELMRRLEEPTDPAIAPLLDRIYNNYARKLPQLQQYLEMMLDSMDIPCPWREEESLAGVGTTSGGVWTPGSGDPATAPQEESGGKLWVPGMD